MKHLKILILFILIAGISSSCEKKSFPKCVKNGVYYCKSAGISDNNWYDYYTRGLSCMEGECYEAALSDFDASLMGRSKDQRKARTSGMHFIDYFPHREKGVIYYLKGEYEKAKRALAISIRDYPSAKAYYYLDETRKRIMEQERQTVFPPKLDINILSEFYDISGEIWIKDDPVIISGIAEDEKQYISKILFKKQSDDHVEIRPVFIENSLQQMNFRESLTLEQGRHQIDVIARNLMGGQAAKQMIIHIDRTGPVIIVEKFEANHGITGYLYDESGDISLLLDNKPIAIPKGKAVPFHIPVKPDIRHLKLLALDKLGNETAITINSDSHKITRHSNLLFAQSPLEITTDVPNLSKEESIEIKTKNWKAYDTVFKENIWIEAEIQSKDIITSISINQVPMLRNPGKMMAFNYFMRLKEGENIITIQVTDISGNTGIKTIHITRKIPVVFQLAHRYSLIADVFDNTKQNIKNLQLQYLFLENLLKQKRFQITIPAELENILRHQGLTHERNDNLKQNHSKLLGIIYETRNGIEIAIELVNIETSEILATADAYHVKKGHSALESLAKELSEKFHHRIPIMQGYVSRTIEDKLLINPEKWKPAEEKIKPGFPLLIYREKHPEDKIRGTDTEIIGKARIDRLAKMGNYFVIIEDKQHNIISADKVITP